MSYADNIESALKNLEAREEFEAGKKAVRRDGDKSAARAAAPFAEKLQKGAFTDSFLGHITRIGHRLRTKPHIFWSGTTLRLEARDHSLELRPTPKGVVAHFFKDGAETASEPVDLDGNAEKLAERWMSQVGPRPA